MAIEKEYPGHPDLTGGGVTNLHSHTDGNGGANVKSGISTGPYGEEKQVDFLTAFASIPNVVIATTSGKPVGITEVTATYFKWKDWQYSGEVTVHWIATDAGNP